jgi:hypothetical protein
MPKSDYIHANENSFSSQLQTFQTGIAGYSTLLGLSAAQVTAQGADADYLAYVLACREISQNDSQQWNAWKNLIRFGSSGKVPAIGEPVVPPALPVPVPAVEPGIEPRFRALVKQIKAHPNYNSAIGEALGIEGPQQAGPDLSSVQPVFPVEIVGTEVRIGWNWGGNSAFLDMLEIQVDRTDSGTYVLLSYDTTPGYVDTEPFPATPTKWTYRGIYRVGDSRVGQWSNPVSVTVGG